MNFLQHDAKRSGSSDLHGRWLAGKGDWLRAKYRLELSGESDAKVPVPFSCEPLERRIKDGSVNTRGRAPTEQQLLANSQSPFDRSPISTTNRPFIAYSLFVLIFFSIAPTAFAADVTVSSVVLRLLDEAEAPARVAGVVISVEAQEGDRVKRGDLLAQLDDAEAKLAVTTAKIDTAIARQAAENDTPIRYAAKAAEAARAELRRSTESIAKFPRSVSQSQIDVERLTIEKATLEKESAEETQKQAKLEHKLRESRLDAAKLELTRRQIVAPLDGVVVETLVRPGEWLQPGQKAFRIVRTDRLKAEGFVLAREAHADLIGKPITLKSPSPPFGGGARGGGLGANDTPQGRIVFVSPEVDPITNQVRVWAEIDNRDGTWRPGDRVEMTILSGLTTATVAEGSP